MPNYAHPIVQRDHNRQLVFAAEQDAHYYVSNLRELKKPFGGKIYAYSLMTNHAHLPLASDEAIAGLGTY